MVGGANKLRKYILSAAAAALCAAVPASAAWKRVSSEHFIIYSEQSADELSTFARQLELFDSAVRLGRGIKNRPVGDGNRVTVFVVPDIRAVQRLYGVEGGVAGFYNPSVEGPMAIVPEKGQDEYALTQKVIFFHEYGHHLMLQDFNRPAPGWLVEGFAEMVSTARFEPDGRVSLGLPANHRGLEVFYRRAIPIETILKGDYSDLSGVDYWTLYGRSWMLTHYLTFDPARHGQLENYMAHIAKGEDPIEAAKAAFGDLKTLQRDMEKHARAKQLPYLSIPSASLKVSPFKVEDVSPGSDAIMKLRMELRRGVDDKTVKPLAAKIRRVAAPYPDDPFVQVTLAEVEHDGDQLDAADSAADRALQADKSLIDAMIYKGRIAMKRGKALQGKAKDEQFAKAREWLSKASRRDPEDPEPLYLLYKSFEDQGLSPTAFAIAALHRASMLVPQDDRVRLISARQFLVDGKVREGRAALVPIAFDPHARKRAEFAQKLIDTIDASGAAAALELIEKKEAEDKAKKDKGKED